MEAWIQDPPTNYGMVLISSGADGLLESAESGIMDERPELEITYQ